MSDPLTDVELGVLATLLYRDDFWAVSGRYIYATDGDGNNLTLDQVLDKFHQDAESDDPSTDSIKEWSVGDLGGWMTEEEWKQVRAAVKENPNLANLKLGDVDTYRGGLFL